MKTDIEQWIEKHRKVYSWYDMDGICYDREVAIPVDAVRALLKGKALCDADEITRYKALAGELTAAIAAHRHDVWGDWSVDHPSDIELYAALDKYERCAQIISDRICAPADMGKEEA